MKRTARALVIFLLCAGFSSGARSESLRIESKQTLDENQVYDKLSSRLVTPHIKWANPYYLGKTRVLVIAPAWSQRETVELAQRLSMDYAPLMVVSYDKFFIPDMYLWVSEDVFLEVTKENLSRDYDVIVIGKLNWGLLPPEYQSSILDKVHQGTGLVYISPKGADDKLARQVFQPKRLEDEKGFISTGIPFDVLPMLRDISRERLISLSQFGEGRVVVLDYGWKGTDNHSLTPSGVYEDTWLWYEYYHSFLAKAVLWAAKKEPSVYIKEIASPNDVLKQEELAASVLRIKLASEKEERVDLQLVIRDLNNKREHEEKRGIVLKAGLNELSFKIPFLKEGGHFLDCWVKKGEEVVNWGSTFLTVEAPIRIEKISLSKGYYKQGEKIQGKIGLNHALSEDLYLRLEVMDSFGRIVVAKELKARSREIPFGFTVSHPLSILFKVKAVVYSEQGIVQEKVEEFSIPRREWDDFSFVIWRGEPPREYIGNLVLEQYERYGADAIDVYYVPGRSVEERKFEARRIAELNLDVLPYISLIYSPGPELIREPCLTDPKYREEVEANLRKYAPVFVPYGPIGYSLGDENILSGGGGDLCFSPTCLDDFRVYVQKVYKNLGALNEEWDTDYGSWNEVKPLTLEEAKQTGNFAPWVDHRLHMEEVFADIHAFSQEIIQQMDPGARVGFDGAMGTTWHAGYNWWRLMSNHDLMNVYWNINQMELVRSFARGGEYLGMWYGTYEGRITEDHTRYAPWECLFHDFNSCWWWMGFGWNGASAFTPSLDPLPCFSQTSEEIKEIKKGLGKLLINAERESGQIAIHYSPSSVHASKIDHTPTDIRSSWRNFILLLEDLQLPFKFLSSEQIERGELKKGYELLILPYSQAISVKEARQMKDFVKRGGMLIADFSPGVMDEHGKKLPQPSLADLFQGEKGEVKDYGKGKSVLLGDLTKDYEQRRIAGTEGDIKKEILKTLARGDIKPGFRVVTKSGEQLGATPAFFFKDGGIEYVGILRDFEVNDKEPKEVTIEFPYNAYLYDVREGKFHGDTDRVKTVISPARAKLFALLPYKIENVDLSLNREVCDKGNLLSYAIKISTRSAANRSGAAEVFNHVFNLEVIGPDNQVLECYTRNILAPEGRFSGVIPLSLNESEGIYKIRVREAVSGLIVEKGFAVR